MTVSQRHFYAVRPLPAQQGAAHASQADRRTNAPGSVRIHAWPVFMISLSAVLTLVGVLTLSWLARVALRTVFF
jgi:hypothetical protein